jgi:hypothetical protein
MKRLCCCKKPWDKADKTKKFIKTKHDVKGFVALDSHETGKDALDTGLQEHGWKRSNVLRYVQLGNNWTRHKSDQDRNDDLDQETRQSKPRLQKQTQREIKTFLII